MRAAAYCAERHLRAPVLSDPAYEVRAPTPTGPETADCSRGATTLVAFSASVRFAQQVAGEVRVTRPAASSVCRGKGRERELDVGTDGIEIEGLRKEVPAPAGSHPRRRRRRTGPGRAGQPGRPGGLTCGRVTGRVREVACPERLWRARQSVSAGR